MFVRSKHVPEVAILIVLAATQSERGITLNEMSRLYESIAGKHPRKETLLRLIKRINEALDPGGPPALRGEYQGDRKQKYYKLHLEDTYFNSMIAMGV